MSEKRFHFIKEFDWIRIGLMLEPKGHFIVGGSLGPTTGKLVAEIISEYKTSLNLNVYHSESDL